MSIQIRLFWSCAIRVTFLFGRRPVYQRVTATVRIAPAGSCTARSAPSRIALRVSSYMSPLGALLSSAASARARSPCDPHCRGSRRIRSRSLPRACSARTRSTRQIEATSSSAASTRTLCLIALTSPPARAGSPRRAAIRLYRPENPRYSLTPCRTPSPGSSSPRCSRPPACACGSRSARSATCRRTAPRCRRPSPPRFRSPRTRRRPTTPWPRPGSARSRS